MANTPDLFPTHVLRLTSGTECVPSLRPILNVDPVTDAKILYKSFQGIGCDEGIIITILTHRTAAQRERIKTEYFRLYNSCLIKRAVSELYRSMEYLALCLLYTGPDADAYIIRKAVKGLGTEDTSLIHVLCTRSSVQISQIAKSYQQLFKTSLRNDVISDTSGNYKDILVYLIDHPRKNTSPDLGLASQQVLTLYSRENFIFSLSKDLIPIFGESSYQQISLINNIYLQQFGKSLPSHFHRFSGNYEACLRTITMYAINPIAYYASFLRTSILNECIRDVITVVTARAEIDLTSILNCYVILYGSRPENDIMKAFNHESSTSNVASAITMLFGIH